ncbi:MAG: toll/interleukin-1 receptor domain-containing protein, partial [Planctomycetes bacterium]|nr:toll/interleukin-1 receptor domain-containing protein [Planctomycetota bacterium]
MAAFAPGYQHDVFVSYGCVDDQSSGHQLDGWVSQFIADLEQRLSERLGRRDAFSIWRDEEQLTKNGDLDQQIFGAISQTAFLLVILSPGYLKSIWCQRELSQFRELIQSRTSGGSRVFIVERDWIEGPRPSEFQNVLGFKFWTGEPGNHKRLPRPLNRRLESDYPEYAERMNDLALTVAAELSRLKTQPSAPPVTQPAVPGQTPIPPPVSSGKTVFLAEVTDDLRPQWNKVRRELELRGVRVVSGGLPREATETEQAVAQSLTQAQIFVQLLSQFPGQPLPGRNETYPLLQYRLAKVSQQPLQILQWRAPQLTEELFDQQEVEDPELTRLHRQMVFGKVRAEHIEDFKKHVVGVATAPPPPPPPVPDTGSGLVFVSYHPTANDDEQLAQKLIGCLDQQGYGIAIHMPEDDADPQVIRADFERFVLSARSWLVVYGDHKKKYWVRGQL